MARRHSTILLIIGICNILMGCLALFCGTCGAGTIVVAAKTSQDLADYMNNRIFGWLAWEIAKHGISVLLGMLLILGGIGLLVQKRWGWLLTLFCAPCTLLQQFAYVLFQLLFVVPAVNDYQRQVQGIAVTTPAERGQAVGTIVGIILAASVHCIYALVTVIVLLLPATFRDLRRAESSRGEEEASWEREDDGDDDDWPRRRRRLREA